MSNSMNTQDSQSELREKIKSAIKSPMRSQISTADIAVGMMSSTKLSEVIFDIESLIEAYVATRVKEAERDLIILKSHTSYLAGALEGILGEPHPYVLKHLPALTTTTNGKEQGKHE